MKPRFRVQTLNQMLACVWLMFMMEIMQMFITWLISFIVFLVKRKLWNKPGVLIHCCADHLQRNRLMWWSSTEIVFIYLYILYFLKFLKKKKISHMLLIIKRPSTVVWETEQQQHWVRQVLDSLSSRGGSSWGLTWKFLAIGSQMAWTSPLGNGLRQQHRWGPLPPLYICVQNRCTCFFWMSCNCLIALDKLCADSRGMQQA